MKSISPIRLFGCFLALAFSVFLSMTNAVGSDNGWFEVTKGMAASVQKEQSTVGAGRRSGDLAWMPEPGVSWRLVSLRATGSEQHAGFIANYNAMNVNQAIPANRVLMIPSSLLAPEHAPKSRTVATNVSNSQIRERSNLLFDSNIRPLSAPASPVVRSSGTGAGLSNNEQNKSSQWRFTTPENVSDAGNVVTIDSSVTSQADKLRLSQPIDTVNINMFSGQVKVLGKVDVTRVAVGNGDIIRAEVLQGGELLVIAQAPGSTSLRLWHTDESQTDFNIRISENDPEPRVRMENMVRMRVRMIEFRKSALGRLGIDWSDSAAGPGFAIAGDAVGNNLFRPATESFGGILPNTVPPFQTYFGIASNITSRIDFLASTGDATTLAEPVLSTTSGGSASFLAGGEVPYPSIGTNGQTIVQFKEYGIKLNVSPVIDPAGNVRTIVETEISQLDPAVSVQGAPGLLTRKAKTQVNVRSGETIVISGLLSSDSSKDVDKLPGIANLPIIGQLFRTRNARNTVSELVIFVTPEIIVPSGPMLSERQQAFFDTSERRVQQAQQKIQLLD